MGFHDANWATTLDLPMAQKVVLLAICLRADDKSHVTLVGQQTIAAMLGASVDTVRRASAQLESRGVISRRHRNGRNGYRTSDEITVMRTYMAERLEGGGPTRPEAYKAERRGLTGSLLSPTRQSAGAEEVIQSGHSDDQAVATEIDLFENAWAHWPRKNSKAKAKARFSKLKNPEQIAAAIVTHGDAHSKHTDLQFVPHLVTWLNGERWDDPIPTATPVGQHLAEAPSSPRRIVSGRTAINPLNLSPKDEWKYDR